MSALSAAALQAMAHVAQRSVGPPIDPTWRVNLHFHPDRWYAGTDGRQVLVLESLARDGSYRSQFETRTSNGGLTAAPGGDRWLWESRIFGEAYDRVEPGERPVYGALNHRNRPHGAAPRFGSCYLRLSAAATSRATFCFPDSASEPTDFGVAERCGLGTLADASSHDRLDDYVEAQVHGRVSLTEDVEALVLDPCYRGTVIERLAETISCEIGWHPGFRASLSSILAEPTYRGPATIELARQVAEDGWLDARMIGDAARTDRAPAQDLKLLWHCVARFGQASSD